MFTDLSISKDLMTEFSKYHNGEITNEIELSAEVLTNGLWP